MTTSANNQQLYHLAKAFKPLKLKKAYEIRKYSTSKVNKEIAHVVSNYPQFFDLWISSLSKEDYINIETSISGSIP